RVDHLLTLRDVNKGLRLLEDEKREYQQMEKWISYGNPIYEIEKKRRRGLHLDAPKVASQLNDISKKLEQLTAQLEKEAPSFPQNLADRGQEVVKGHLKAIESVFKFYDGYDPDFSWWMETPYARIT